MDKQLSELLYQMLETELGGVQVYENALKCAVNPELKKEWSEYLEQTRHHVEVMQELFEKVGLDPAQETPGRKVVRHIGESLVASMQMAKQGGQPKAAELVACECVVLAETKDHTNWTLLAKVAEKGKGEQAKALKEAVDEVEDEEDEHLYHSKGWCRELWLDSLGVEAVLPPPEEQKDVRTAMAAARAQEAREKLL
jgi:rubrerythrin